MSNVERRYEMWLELVADLVTSPGHHGFPRAAVEAALTCSFHCQVSWQWRDADGTSGFELAGGPALQDMAGRIASDCAARGGVDDHPLLRWFACTGDSTAMSAARVPHAVAPPDSVAAVHEVLSPYEYDQQLSIPFRMLGKEHRAYVLARGSEDFSDEDLVLARRIQPLLELLDRQVQILERRRGSMTSDLTGRELAVLALLADGHTSVAIAHRLAISPRTAQKHLENLYRKLGVCDRLQAVLVAREAGILGRAPSQIVPSARTMGALRASRSSPPPRRRRLASAAGPSC